MKSNQIKQIKKKQFQNLFRGSIKPSYFRALSKENLINLKEQFQQPNQQTFRILEGFKPSQENYKVYGKDDKFYINQASFLCCVRPRNQYKLSLFNYKLTLQGYSKIQQFYNFQTQAITIENHGRYFIISILKCQNKFYFEPVGINKQEIVQEWVVLLNKIANITKCRQKKYCFLPFKNIQFYKKQHIDQKQFFKKCNTLDIILFKSTKIVIQQHANSQYDHIGVIFRNKQNQVFIFQSTANEGVCLTPWKHLLKYEWYDSTDIIAWRRLNIELTLAQIQIIQKFIINNLGKKLSIAVQKLFNFKCVLQLKQQVQSKTYLSSELVARLYKQIGILDTKKALNKYVPIDFSEKKTLQWMINKVYLKPQVLLSFNNV